MRFLKKRENLVAVDIGSSSVKIVELSTASDRPQLINIGIVPIANESIAGNLVAKIEQVSEQVSGLFEANSIVDKRVALSMPSPSVFTKRIQVQKVPMKELRENIFMEAGNYIPHNTDAVKIDFHVIGQSGKSQLDVLLVAVKGEVVDSFLDTVSLAGLEPAVVDVDYFTIQNIFEHTHPELIEKTVALVNIGARFTSVNICRNGMSLFTGDISLGGKTITDEIASTLEITFEEAEQLKRKPDTKPHQQQIVTEILDRSTENAASELNRQLSFFWSAAGAEDSIDQIILSGGGSLLPGLGDELSAKTGIECSHLNPFANIECGSAFEAEYLRDLSALMAVGMGLALREPGDKIYDVDGE